MTTVSSRLSGRCPFVCWVKGFPVVGTVAVRLAWKVVLPGGAAFSDSRSMDGTNSERNPAHQDERRME